MKKFLLLVVYLVITSVSFAYAIDCKHNFANCGGVFITPTELNCSPNSACGPIKITNQRPQNINLNFSNLPSEISFVDFVPPCTGVVAANGGECEINFNIANTAVVGSSFEFLLPVNITSFGVGLKVKINLRGGVGSNLGYFINSGATDNNILGSFDLTNNTAFSAVPIVGANPANASLAISSSQNKAYILGQQPILIVNLSTNQQHTFGEGGILVSPLATSMAITQDGKTGYAVSSNKISTLNLSDDTLTGAEIAPANFFARSSLSLQNDSTGYISYVGNFSEPNNRVGIIDFNTESLAGNIKDGVFEEPQAMGVFGTRGFVANAAGNSVAVVDLTGDNVANLVDDTNGPFNQPQAMAVVDPTLGLVSNAGNNTISMVNITTSGSEAVSSLVTGLPPVFVNPRAITIDTIWSGAGLVPHDNGVSRIDPTGGVWFDEITDSSFNDPQVAAISSFAAQAYVANRGGDSITLIDNLDGTPVASTLALGVPCTFSAPRAMAINPTTNLGYVTNTNGIVIIDTFTNMCSTKINGFYSEIAPAVVNDPYIYAPYQGGILILQGTSPDSLISMPLWLTPVAMVVDGSTGYVSYTAASGKGYVAKVDLSNPGTPLYSLMVDDGSTLVNSAAMAISPVTPKAYIANGSSTPGTGVLTGDTVSVVNLTTNAVTGTVTGMFNNPGNITFNSDGTMAYVVEHDSIAIITVASDTVNATVDNPDSLVFAGRKMQINGDVAYVPFEPDGAHPKGGIAVINLTTNKVTSVVSDPSSYIKNPVSLNLLAG